MASTSSGAQASSGAEACIYDAFLSFRGEDTRHSFTDHLYHRLKRAGIHTFRDDEEVNRGEELKPGFEKAIKASKASIVVLSENYATSAWCLDELLLILKQRRECNHFVLPVFYHVEPTDIRNQKGSFALEVKPSSRWTYENVYLWERALMEVANLSGFTLSGHETGILKKIVDTMYNKLGPKDVHLPLNITGMATRYDEINSWLDQSNLEILVIYGMGGSGKTTLAKYIYDSNQKSFEYISFIENIGSRSKGTNDLLQLQEQLIRDIFGGKKRKISAVSRGTCMIEEALQMKRALIVLDDVVEQSQLHTLLGTGIINSQSKIIITTRERFDLSCWRCQKYEMKLLNNDESLELLCRHAFRSKTPMIGFEELVLQAIQYCEGNPLALEVLGSSMSNNTTINYWRSQLNLLEKDIHSRIQSVLIRSYMALPYNTQKELFLHIACFFTDKDVDYVIQILEPDYSAISGIQTLIDRCLLSVSPNKKLIMHRLLQEMGKNIVRQESMKFPAKRSRVWLSNDSYKILNTGKASEKIEGLALDMKMLSEENFALKSSYLSTGAFKKMVNLKLLQLNFAELKGSYKHVSEDLRWLCWHGFNLRIIPADLCMENLVAVDMSYSNLEVFEPPTDIQSLKILNLKDSHKLSEIRNITRVPNLETLILWNCYNLVNVCENLGDLSSLVLLNMTGCKSLYSYGHSIFSFPFSLHRLFLKDCHLECTDSFPLSFSVQPYLQYLNLCNSLFESLPCYNHLENLRVLDLSFCSRLKRLLCLPSTLAELYIYYCESLEKITFQSHRFTLQEFGYEGCNNLYEVEGFIKLQAIVKVDETDLGHMKWLKEFQNYEMCLGGDDELTIGRSMLIQMLYEFDIMSTSLPNLMEPIMTLMYTSKSSSLSFDVPSCPDKRLEGIYVTFKYSISGDDDMTWFCKITTTNGIVDLMYNPKVFGKPEFGEVCIWVSYWPIGYTLNVGDIVNVSILVMSGLKVHECGVSLVYSDQETVENNMGCDEILGGDLSGFQLSTGAYYLCRRDFFELTEVGRLTPDWFRILVGDTIDHTEVRGWRKTGRPKQVNPSFTELKTIRCIIHGPQSDDIYNIAEMVKSSIGDKAMAFTSRLLEWEMKSGIRSELTGGTMAETKSLPSPPEIYDKQEIKSDDETDGDFVSTFDDITIEESDPYSHLLIQEQKEGEGTSKAFDYDEIKSHSPPHDQDIKKIVFAVNLSNGFRRYKMMKALNRVQGIKLIDYDKKERKLTVIGDVDYVTLGARVRKIAHTDLLSVEPASEELAKQHDKSAYKSGEEDKPGYESDRRIRNSATREGESLSSSSSAHPCCLFSLAEITSATNNFAGELLVGEGGFGKVYKGQISSKEADHVVAIKRWKSTSHQGELEFRAEIDTLCRFHHRHLVSLIGYHYDNKEMILVYEYMPNGSLNHHLHNDHAPISWLARLKIAIGAARGLAYIHTGLGTEHGVIHRNVKSASILLDKNWEAVISGFGLSIIGPTDQSDHVLATLVGTIGYLDPECFLTGKYTYKSDVYSFGVVLFELISGRRAIDTRYDYDEDECNLIAWAQKCIKEGKLDEMVDSNIKGTTSTICLRGFAQIADRCVHNVSEERPTMSELLTSLQALLELHENSATREGENLSSSTSAHPCRLFSLAEITSATNNFAGELLIGEGGFGRVYKGQISSKEAGHIVAIKRWNSMSNQGEHGFRAEINTLCRFHHRHLVSLIGYYYDNKEKILVYEYMPNGSLYHHLHNAHTPLSWVTRLNIAIGAARGLDYLHTCVGTRHGVIHRNVASANILLDENWEAVISDFGLSIIGPTDPSDHFTASVAGTIGYLAPEYAFYGNLTYKSDVYSFGAVLFELISGRRAFDYVEDEPNLVLWAQKCIKEGKLDQMVDSNIKGKISTQCLREFAQIADRCVRNDLDERPTMNEVLTSLQDLLELHEKPDCFTELSDVMGQSGTSSQQE